VTDIKKRIPKRLREQEERKKKRAMDAYLAWAKTIRQPITMREAAGFHAGFGVGYRLAMDQVRRYTYLASMGASP